MLKKKLNYDVLFYKAFFALLDEYGGCIENVFFAMDIKDEEIKNKIKEEINWNEE